MNKFQFAKAAGITDELAERWFVPVNEAMEEFGITGAVTQAMFIAQTGHESQGFTRVTENLNYSAAGLKATFGKYFSDRQAQLYGRTAEHPASQQAIANIVYANRMGNVEKNDGWKYRGRGLIQITGHDNYAACGAGLHVDLVLVPDLLEQDSYAARSAAWYWHYRGCGAVAANTAAVTRLINGGLNGLDDRNQRFERALSVLKR